MILDSLENINTYGSISDDLYSGLRFLRNLEPDIALGTYPIKERVRAIVEEYYTEANKTFEFESHKTVIDIQYPVLGIERVVWSPIELLDIKTPYSEQSDCTIFESPTVRPGHVDIGNGIFAVMFESDGHSPKHCVDNPQLIKKVTVKVSID